MREPRVDREEDRPEIAAVGNTVPVPVERVEETGVDGEAARGRADPESEPLRGHGLSAEPRRPGGEATVSVEIDPGEVGGRSRETAVPVVRPVFAVAVGRVFRLLRGGQAGDPRCLAEAPVVAAVSGGLEGEGIPLPRETRGGVFHPAFGGERGGGSGAPALGRDGHQAHQLLQGETEEDEKRQRPDRQDQRESPDPGSAQ